MNTFWTTTGLAHWQTSEKDVACFLLCLTIIFVEFVISFWRDEYCGSHQLTGRPLRMVQLFCREEMLLYLGKRHFNSVLNMILWKGLLLKINLSPNIWGSLESSYFLGSEPAPNLHISSVLSRSVVFSIAATSHVKQPNPWNVTSPNRDVM